MKKCICLLLIISFIVLLTSPVMAENWICPSCGNDADGNFCNNCGNPKPENNNWICPACGNEASGNFCNNCGAPRPSEQTPAESETITATPTIVDTPAPTPVETATPLPLIESTEAIELVNEAKNHITTHIYSSPDKYTYYIQDYVGLNLATIGYTSLSGKRFDKYGKGLLRIIPIAIDGSYIDIEDKDILEQYIVIGQNIEPNTEMKLTYKKDSSGKEYSNLIDCQNIETIDLLVARIDGSVAGDIIQYTPITILPSPDRYTCYIKNYVGKNLANVGYISLGGDLRDEYLASSLEFSLVTVDGTYVDIEDKDLLQQYIVIGQNVAPNTEIKLVYRKDSNGKEYDNLVDSIGIEVIDLQIARIDGLTYNDPVAYNPVMINPSPDKYTQYVRNYVGKNLAACGYTSLGGKRMDQYGGAYVELSLVTPDRTVIDISDIDQIKQYVVVAQSVDPNTEIKIKYQTDSRGNEYNNLVDTVSVQKITLTLEKINTLPEVTPAPPATSNITTTTAAPVESSYNGPSYTANEFTYVLDNQGNAIITGYNGSKKSTSIPSELDGHEVYGIGPSAFEGHSELTDIVIWADLTFVDARAFMGCTKLQDISLPYETKRIGASAFEGCTSLSSVILWGDPDIDDRAFFGCTSLKKISIGVDTERIGVSAFEGCTKLSSVTLWGDPDICDRAFFGCTSLEKISIGTDTEFIGESAFEGCTSLKSVTLWGDPNIENRAFYGCTALQKISIGAGTEYIGDYAFYGCTNLKKVTMWSRSTRIGTEAFGNCPKLENPPK